MKLRSKLKVKPSLTVDKQEAPTQKYAGSKRGPKSVLGPCERFSMFVPDSMRKDHEALLKEMKANGITVKLPLATVLREGGIEYIAKKRSELHKAAKGEFHAKKRK